MKYNRNEMTRATNASFVLVLFVAVSLAQPRPPNSDFTAGSLIPTKLKPSLISGLESYTLAQREKRWEDLWVLMGKHKLTGAAKFEAEKEKPCILDQIKSSPLVSFTPEYSTFSTEILSLPLPKRWWLIHGSGTFETKNGNIERKTTIVASRSGNSWYFAGPSRDREWEKEHVDLKTPSSELAKFISVLSPPSSPVSVEDIRVSINSEYLSLRKLRFKLRNGTSKQIKSIAYRIASRGGNISVGAGQVIDPSEAEEFEVTYSGYGYYCQGERQFKLIVETVTYSDDSTWKAPPKFRSRSYLQLPLQ